MTDKCPMSYALSARKSSSGVKIKIRQTMRGTASVFTAPPICGRRRKRWATEFVSPTAKATICEQRSAHKCSYPGCQTGLSASLKSSYAIHSAATSLRDSYLAPSVKENKSLAYCCSATTHFAFRSSSNSDPDTDPESDDDYTDSELIDVPTSALGSGAAFIAFVATISKNT